MSALPSSAVGSSHASRLEPGSGKSPNEPERVGATSPALFVAWISTTTLVAALLVSSPVIETWVRPTFFGALLVFFVCLGRRRPELRSLPWRLIEIGFLLLSLGNASAILLRNVAMNFGSPVFRESLAFALDRGVGFLLGMSSLGYGIVLWVPEILESQQRTRDELQHAAQVLERQDALVTVGELAAGVAHELRNPLAIVKSALQRLRNEELEEVDAQKCLDVMERAVHKANARISGLLDLGRITNYDPQAVKARAFLENVAGLARAQASEIGLTIEVVAPPELEFWGDRELILQILLNLVRNAIQAGPHRGSLRLVAEAMGQAWTRMLVEDSGCGLSTQAQGQAFEAFFTTKREGNGLGLSICASLAERHRGRILLSQRPGGGTRAALELPPRETAHV